MKGTIRQRLTISVVAVTTVMLALLVLGFNIALRSSLDGDANRLLDARAQAALESVAVNGNQLSVNESSDEGAPDSLVWIFDGDSTVESPQVGGRLDALAASMARAGQTTAEDEQDDVRLHAVPVMSRGSEVGTVVSGVSLEPYEKTASRAAIASVILGLIMIGLVAVTTSLVVKRALKPVAKMTAEAADWSEHDLDRRFNEGEPTDELTQLAATFDTMLERLAFMVRHERNFSAELSHELRTPLSAIAAEAEIALKRVREPGEYRESLEQISERSRELARILEILLDVARSESGDSARDTADVGQVIQASLDSNAQVAKSYGVEARPVFAEEGLEAQVGAETMRRIFSPVFENALAYAGGVVEVEARSHDRMVEITVSDDGPGFTAEEVPVVFEPGGRGSAERNAAAPSSTGLGLPLARRLARANGGDVIIVERDGRTGGVVRISLPAAI